MSASLNSISSNQSGVSRKLGNYPRLNFNTNDPKKKFSKTANGNITPLRLVNAKKSNTPQGNLLLNDRLVAHKPIIPRSTRKNSKILLFRYIPSRINSNYEMSYHLISSSNADSRNINTNRSNSNSSNNIENQVDTIKRKLIADTCNGVSDKAKILNLHAKPHEFQEMPVIETMKATYSSSNLFSNIHKSNSRVIETSPERILDAPDFRNDYCNLDSRLYRVFLFLFGCV